MTRKIRRFAVSPFMFVEISKHGLAAAQVVQNPLPEDAQYSHTAYDLAHDQFYVFVTSESFEDVDEGAIVPVHPDIVFHSKDVECLNPSSIA